MTTTSSKPILGVQAFSTRRHIDQAAPSGEACTPSLQLVWRPRMTKQILPTTVVGSYPQPDWLIDRALLKQNTVPRVRVREVWRIAEPHLQEAQDDATILAIRDMER